MPQDRFLTLKIPTHWKLTRSCELTKSITLLPSSRVEVDMGQGSAAFCCSFRYVEKHPPQRRCGPSDWPEVTSYENLRDFIEFVDFTLDNQYARHAFELGDPGPEVVSELPAEEPSEWNNNPGELDPDSVRLRCGPKKSAKSFTLRELYAQFLSVDTRTRQLVSLFLFRPLAYLHNKNRRVYDNWLLQSSLHWVVVDALSPPAACESTVECPKCGTSARSRHVPVSFRERMETELLAQFEKASEYAQLLNRFRRERGGFFHNAEMGSSPEERHPDRDPSTGRRERTTNLDETLTDFGKEALATENARHLLGDIVYALLLNRVYPAAKLWPEFSHLWSFYSR